MAVFTNLGNRWKTSQFTRIVESRPCDKCRHELVAAAAARKFGGSQRRRELRPGRHIFRAQRSDESCELLLRGPHIHLREAPGGQVAR